MNFKKFKKSIMSAVLVIGVLFGILTSVQNITFAISQQKINQITSHENFKNLKEEDQQRFRDFLNRLLDESKTTVKTEIYDRNILSLETIQSRQNQKYTDAQRSYESAKNSTTLTNSTSQWLIEYDLYCLINAYKISVELLKTEINTENFGKNITDLNVFIYDMKSTNFERLLQLLNQTFC